LARLLGIPPGKVFLRKHLLRKFLDIVGPVVAQSKLDAQQVKNFSALDPMGKSKVNHVAVWFNGNQSELLTHEYT